MGQKRRRSHSPLSPFPACSGRHDTSCTTDSAAETGSPGFRWSLLDPDCPQTGGSRTHSSPSACSEGSSTVSTTGYVASSHVSPFSLRLYTRLFLMFAYAEREAGDTHDFGIEELVQPLLLLFLRVHFRKPVLKRQNRRYTGGM